MTITKSPTVSVPACTPIAAIPMMITSPVEIRKAWPKFSSASADAQMQATIDGLKNQGVAFKICANTLKGKAVNIDQHLYMADASDVVPGGVAELAHLQAQGFTYVKP